MAGYIVVLSNCNPITLPIHMTPALAFYCYAERFNLLTEVYLYWYGRDDDMAVRRVCTCLTDLKLLSVCLSRITEQALDDMFRLEKLEKLVLDHNEVDLKAGVD